MTETDWQQNHTKRQKLYILLCDSELLVQENFEGSVFWIASDERLNRDELGSELFVGIWKGAECWVCDLSKQQAQSILVEGSVRITLRSLLDVDEEMFALAGRAVQLVNSVRDHQYCGRCGSPTRPIEGEHAHACQPCEIQYYPRLSPCAIMLVTKGEYCLLARHAGRGKWHTCLAGYVEAGETVEQTVRREVLEEVDVNVGELSYFGSQNWPFPGQLMLGFHAEYQSGDIKPDGIEVVEADWFHYSELPPYPSEQTLSGRLIRSFVERAKAAE